MDGHHSSTDKKESPIAGPSGRPSLPPLPPRRDEAPGPPSYVPSDGETGTAMSTDTKDVKDPLYAPFLPESVTETFPTTSASTSPLSPSDYAAETYRGSSPLRTEQETLAMYADPRPADPDPLPPYVRQQPQPHPHAHRHPAQPRLLIPTAAQAGDEQPMSPVSDAQIAEWKRGPQPILEADAQVDDDGMIGVTIDVQGPMDKPLPLLPPDWQDQDQDRDKKQSVYGPKDDFPPPKLATAWSSASRPSPAPSPSASFSTASSSKTGTASGPWLEAGIPRMNIVIFIVGSRGDVQPYIALALALIITHGHRVRIATHPDFEKFVTDANTRLRGLTHEGLQLEGQLEHFDVGGDPKSLMEYMVKNPGLMPGFESLTNGDIRNKREMTATMLRGFYRSTFCPDNVSGRAFAADAIISNPPAFAHLHIAEALGIPLEMSFTMPWTATQSFPHPLINVKRSNADKSLTNWMGYGLADALMWEGLGTTINTFRTKDLRLDTLPDRLASNVVDTLRVPWTYCWSPDLLPKPQDWRGHIDVSGFYFLEGEVSFAPPHEMAEFLKNGEPPVYIGFGSVPIPNPEVVTGMLFDAIEQAGVRAIISAGWAGLGKGREGSNPNILVWSKDVPHEWLFAENRVLGVMHHGGAGTTACGLRHGRPTIIVPFFGDQKFWGDSVHRAGAGPAPIPFKTVSTETLAVALMAVKTDEVRAAAAVLGERIRSEQGEVRGAESFHRHLPLQDMKCDVDPYRVATLYCERLALRLSPEAAGVLLKEGKILSNDLMPYRSMEHETDRHKRDPLAGTGQAINNVFTTSVAGVGQLFYSPVRGTIKTFYGIPEASFAVVGDLHTGFENLPEMMGSTARPRGKVTGFVSGLEEGSKALGWGLWDGITGLVTEPVDGARREGLAGLGKGFGRGFANMMIRPSAGALGFFVHPIRGARLSVRNAFGATTDPLLVLLGPRIALANEAAQALAPEAKTDLMRAFARLEAPREVAKRKRKRDGTKWFLFANRRERERERIEREREKEEKRLRREMKEEAELEKRRLAGEAQGGEGEEDAIAEADANNGEMKGKGKDKGKGKGKDGDKGKSKSKGKDKGKGKGKEKMMDEEEEEDASATTSAGTLTLGDLMLSPVPSPSASRRGSGWGHASSQTEEGKR